MPKRRVSAGQQGAPLPLSLEQPCPSRPKHPCLERRRMPQPGEECPRWRRMHKQEGALPFTAGTALPRRAKSAPARRRVPLGLAHRWPYNSVACHPFWKSLHSQPKIPLWGSNGCRPHLSPLIRTFTPFYKGGFAVHDTPNYPSFTANLKLFRVLPFLFLKHTTAQAPKIFDRTYLP